MIHEIELEGNKYKLTDDPLYEDVEKVLDMESKMMTGLLGAMGTLSTEDLSKDVNKYIMEIIANDPEKMAKFLTYNNISSGIKTIMLCTGMNQDQIKKLPTKTVFKPLLEKCKELLGGTAEVFMLESGIATTSLVQTAYLKTM